MTAASPAQSEAPVGKVRGVRPADLTLVCSAHQFHNVLVAHSCCSESCFWTICEGKC